MKTVSGKVAAITGAGSGIGRACALLLAKKGCHLSVSDVNEAGLAETVALLKAYPVRVHPARVDVADRAAVDAWANDVVREHRAVNVVINNAGVALAATVEDMQYEDFEWLMNINFWGVVHGVKSFLPHLRASGDGHIVNVSSVFGILAIPTQSAYNAAKFAVKGFSESLRMELEADGAPVSVTTVHPGGIKTNIARSGRVTERAGVVTKQTSLEFEKLFRTTPERAAEKIVQGILGDQRRVLIGADAVGFDLVQRMLPTLYQRILVAGAKRLRKRALCASAEAASSEGRPT